MSITLHQTLQTRCSDSLPPTEAMAVSLKEHRSSHEKMISGITDVLHLMCDDVNFSRALFGFDPSFKPVPASAEKCLKSWMHRLPDIELKLLVNRIFGALYDKRLKVNLEMEKAVAVKEAAIRFYGRKFIDKMNHCSTTKKLSEIHGNVLSLFIKSFGLTPHQYEGLSQDSNVGIKEDIITKMMTEDELNPRLIELEEEVNDYGIANLKCPELHVVLYNVQTCIANTLESLSDTNKKLIPYLESLEEDAIKLSALVAIPYAETMSLCIKFTFVQSIIDLLSFPEPFFLKAQHNKPSCVDVEKIIKSIYKKELTELPDALTKLEFKFKHFFTNDIVHYTLPDVERIADWINGFPNLLIWPTFGEFDYSFFNKASRYNICIAGITTQKLCFHDSAFLSKFGLFSHDFFHATTRRLVNSNQHKLNVKHVDTTLEQRQKFSKTIEYCKEYFDISTECKQAIELVRFMALHEYGVNNHYLIDNTNEKTPVFTSRICVEFIFNFFSHYQLPESMILHDIHNAVFFLTLVSYSQLHSEDFPELQLAIATEDINTSILQSGFRA